MITRAKVDTLHNRRLLLAKLQDKVVVEKLLKKLGPRYHARPGSCCVLLNARSGDNAPMAYVELVGRQVKSEEAVVEEAKEAS